MRFSIFTSAVLMLAPAAWATPDFDGPVGVESRDDHMVHEARALAEGLQVRDALRTVLLEARKPGWQKVKVNDSTGGSGRGGSIKQNEWDQYEEMAQKALYEAGCESGTVSKVNHGDGTSSQDQETHFTVEPSRCSGKSSGKIHVREGGDWTQGKGGKENQGPGTGEVDGREGGDYKDDGKKGKGKGGGKKGKGKGGKKGSKA